MQTKKMDRPLRLRPARRADFGAYYTIFDALREPLRLQIVRMIGSRADLPCTMLEQTLPITKSTISYHIKILYHAQLIEVRKEGRYYFYKLRREVFESYLPGFLQRLVIDGSSASSAPREAEA
jgi:ArsR family transcriptional regulator